MHLQPIDTAATISRNWTYSQWLPKLTACQRQFLNAPTSRALRLRGPAGSGKTLALTLKAVKEMQSSLALGKRDLRILYLTHSSGLAREAENLISQLSEFGQLDNIDCFPLLQVAELIMPEGRRISGLELIGEDSLEAKELQLLEIEEAIAEFKAGDWVSYREAASDHLLCRFDSADEGDIRGLAWDCLIEFGCVLGADGIFPGFDAERRYLKLPRANWMMPLTTETDKRVIFALYEAFSARMEEQGLLSADQLINDFLNYLETFAWHRRRATEGYDLIFVDEFHLFNTQERQLLKYFGRDSDIYPRLLMALDPRQSPWEVFVGRGANVESGIVPRDVVDTDDVVELESVHRFSPEILELVKHIHLDFPNLDLGSDWDLEVEKLTSTAPHGPVPALVTCGSNAAEQIELVQQARDLYRSLTEGAQLAIAVLGDKDFKRYQGVAELLRDGAKLRITTITSRSDVDLMKHAKRGLILAPAEYLAGLQFDTLLIAGVPDIPRGAANQTYRRRQMLSQLYLAVSRAIRDVRIFVSDDTGEIPDVLTKAVEMGVMTRVSGPQV